MVSYPPGDLPRTLHFESFIGAVNSEGYPFQLRTARDPVTYTLQYGRFSNLKSLEFYTWYQTVGFPHTFGHTSMSVQSLGGGFPMVNHLPIRIKAPHSGSSEQDGYILREIILHHTPALGNLASR